MTSKKIDIGYSPAVRSVLGKTVPEVLDTQDTWVLKTEGIVFPIRTNLRLVNNIFIFFYNRTKGMWKTRTAVIMAEPIRLQLKIMYIVWVEVHSIIVSPSFQVICSQLPVTWTPDNSNLFFPWRFELSGFNCIYLLSFARFLARIPQQH